jgi:hypothetical protein
VRQTEGPPQTEAPRDRGAVFILQAAAAGGAVSCRLHPLSQKGVRELLEAIRDKFVRGLNKPAVQKRLLSENKLTLDKAIEVATAMEAVAGSELLRGKDEAANRNNSKTPFSDDVFLYIIIQNIAWGPRRGQIQAHTEASPQKGGTLSRVIAVAGKVILSRNVCM